MDAANHIKNTTVSAPSRLHFGLLSIGDATARKFGGAGVMIDSPRTTVSIGPSPSLLIESDADSKAAVLETVAKWQENLASEPWRECDLNSLPISVRITGIPRHSGLGSGTQLAFAVASALQIATGQPLPSAEEMAISLGRGKRSAIGSFGFFKGGFLVDRGIGESDSVAPLDMQIDFPAKWKIVLVQPETRLGSSVFGETEKLKFQQLPSTTQSQADALAGILKERIVPGILGCDFLRFAQAVTEYGRLSGSFYSSIQGGPYASKEAASLVKKICSYGEYGVGQSSWGPTLFAIGPSEKSANWLVEKLQEGDEDVACHASVVSADNCGMTFQ